MNNGPYFHNFDIPKTVRMEPDTINVFFYPGAARPQICRQSAGYDPYVPSVLFLTHFFPHGGKIGQLKNSGFFTEYGFATERPSSPYYRSDGYWRGPIWAPSTMLILDGLARCGEMEFVKDAARRFADMVKRSGFAENFDALTGEGLRDCAYTWTSSVFLILAHDYLED